MFRQFLSYNRPFVNAILFLCWFWLASKNLLSGPALAWQGPGATQQIGALVLKINKYCTILTNLRSINFNISHFGAVYSILVPSAVILKKVSSPSAVILKKSYFTIGRHLWLLNTPHIISIPFEIIDE
jgi:hypothetical protein